MMVRVSQSTSILVQMMFTMMVVQMKEGTPSNATLCVSGGEPCLATLRLTTPAIRTSARRTVSPMIAFKDTNSNTRDRCL